MCVESEKSYEAEYFFFSENNDQPDEKGTDGVVFTEFNSGISYVKVIPSSLPVKRGAHIEGVGTVVEVIAQDKIEISF